MAPPAKRRKTKRNIVESDDEEEPLAQVDASPSTPAARKRNLRNYFSPSPNPSQNPTATGGLAPVSPSQLRRQSTIPDSSRAPASPSPLRRQSHPASSNGLGGSPVPSLTRQTTHSPDKKKISTRAQKKKEDTVKSGNLVALFSKQAEAQRTNGVPKCKVVAKEPTKEIPSDPISDDDDFGAQSATASSLVGNNARKRLFKNHSSSSSTTIPTPAGSQIFLKPPQLRSSNSTDDDLRPWSERFAPQNLNELVVHKKKVSDVRTWLEDVICGKLRQRLLVLKGAAGTAKTTTLRLLAKDMGHDILEWRNPAGFMGGTHGYASASAQFEEFMNRGSKFGQLELDTDTPPPMSAPGSKRDGKQEDKGPKIIMIEEFPNTFTRSSNSMAGFRSTVMRYLAANTPSLTRLGQTQPSEDITPVVMIISETLLTTTSASADSFTAYRLLGQEILSHPGTAVIEFNTVAPTLMAKALQAIVLKEARKSGRRRTPGPQVLQRLGEIGDIRNAIGTLEFLCVKGDNNADWGSKIAFTKPKKASKDQALTKGEAESLELVSQREASLGIFHAVGKVAYNKREELAMAAGTDEAEAESLPPHLAHHSRPKTSLVDVDTLIDETGTDTHTFISALHENYALSCETTGPADPNSSLDYVNGCIEYLSESDLLCPSSDSFFGGRGHGGGGYGRDIGGHIVRQDELAFHVAVRGILHSLPVPVKRGSSGGAASRGDQFKMFYPTSIKLWRTKEELGGLLDVWSTKMLQGEVKKTTQQPLKNITQGAAAFKKTKGSSVGDWAGNRSELTYVAAKKATEAARAAAAKGDDDASTLLSLGSAARKEMLLDRLPYMAHIARRTKASFCSMSPRDLEKVVAFQGTGRAAVIGEEEAEDEDEESEKPTGETWATDKPTEESTPKKRKGFGRFRAKKEDESQGSAASGGLGVGSLVIEDDDIEDDW